MAERWSVARVTALAPDSVSEVTARRLANPTPWSDVGCIPPLLWGSCQGSAKTPYRVEIDTSGRSFTCTCPSRKYPCIHVLALLFLWAEGRIDESGGLTAFAAEWATRRSASGSGAASAPSDAPDDAPDDVPAGDAPKAQTAEQRLAAEKRAGQRDERVRTGMVELDRWLDDQVTAGIAATTRHGYPAAQEMAARMVDAQAPAVASRLRDLALMPSSGRDWPDRLVAALGLLHLLAQGTARLDELSPDLRHTVRLRLGYTTPRLEVLGTEPVVDRWAVVGLRDSDEELVSMRRVWLRGVATGTPALVLLFTPLGGRVDNSLLPGMVIEGALHFYPGRPRLRAVMGARGAEVELTDWAPECHTVAEASVAWRDAVADDPWLGELPGLVLGAPVPPAGRHGQAAATSGTRPAGWALVDAAGDALPLIGSEVDRWQLLALTGGHPWPVFGELSSQGLRPTSVVIDGTLVTL